MSKNIVWMMGAAVTVAMRLSAQEAVPVPTSRTLTIPVARIITYDPVLTVNNREYRNVELRFELLDRAGQTVGQVAEISQLDALETRSIVVAGMQAEGTDSIRIQSDGEVDVATSYSLDGVTYETWWGDDRPNSTGAGFSSVDGSDLEGASAVENSGGKGPRKAASCGSLNSSGNPFVCSKGGNCTWWAWTMARDNWNVDFPARGDARTWADSARNAGYRVSATPAANTIGVSTTLSSNGHVFWVTSVSGNQVCGSEMLYGQNGARYNVCRPTATFNAGFIYPPSMTVQSPNGNEWWRLGSVQTVRWNYTGDPGAVVRVDLVQFGRQVFVVADSVPVGSRGTGALMMRVPSWIPAGYYQLRITSKRDGRYADSSDWSFLIY